MQSGIYEIVNTVNGKRYIGSTSNFASRWKNHRFHLARNSHHSGHLQASWNRHGEQAFQFRVMLTCEVERLLSEEQAALDLHRPEFNILRIAGSTRGHQMSVESRAKLSAAKMGNKATLGYKHTPEAIEKLRTKQLGVTSPTKGKPRDRSAVEATAAAHRGMVRSAETRQKIAAKAKGRVRSAESIEKGAAKRRGVAREPEHVAHLLGNKHAAGVTLTDERKAFISAAGRAMWSDPVRRAQIVAAQRAARERRRAGQ